MRPVASAAPNVQIWDGTDVAQVVAATLQLDPTTVQYLTTASALYGYDSGSLVRNTIWSGVDAQANNWFGIDSAAHPFLFNETTWDRGRNNTEITVLASGTRSASASSADLTNYNARGVMFMVDITARTVGATPRITVGLQWKDLESGSYDILFQQTAFDPTVGARDYVVYPGMIDTDTRMVFETGLPLPRVWRVQVLFVADVTNLTYSVGASYIL